ncbi:MAG TPA: class I SAM-dependent methyltransferase [Candidatus Limnocylindria bacterium]|nr:class I SAM-dependent methyltransferase [Candidatus Limnocylindria bacterium]
MSDIFAGQAAEPERLAELYDLEHDELRDDLDFWRELARRHPGPTLDAGCGSGRLFAALLAGGASPLVGVDGSADLLTRAERRIAADPRLAAAAAAGRLRVLHGDVRALGATIPPRTAFGLVVIAGVVPHLEGPEEGVQLLEGAEGVLAPGGRIVVDTLGPAELPQRDLPLSVDWERDTPDGHVVRRSQLTRREAPDGLHVAYATITDTVQADGTIARLPASFRLWYPSGTALVGIVEAAGLTVELTWGSYELDPFDPLDSERHIVVARRRDEADEMPARKTGR